MSHLINAALYPLMHEACMNVRVVLPILERTRRLSCGQARSSDPRSRACRPTGKRTGEDGVSSGVLIILPF